MLKLGTQDISALYLGETKIKRAYLGETLVFEGSKPSRLPEGYTEVEYIQGNGAWVDSGLSVFTRVEAVFEPTALSANSSCLFGASDFYLNSRQDTSVTMSSGTIWLDLGKYTTASIAMPLLNQKSELIADTVDGIFSINGTEKTFTGKASSNGSMYVLYGNKTGSGTTFRKLSAKLYSLKFYTLTSRGIARDFIPCIRNSDGEVGLYEAVKNKFHASSATVKFTAGPPV